MRSIIAAIASGLAAVAGILVAQASAATVNDLAGRWSGWGSITMANGSSEQVKCVATYFVEGGGSQLRQNLRCASQSYKIDASAKLNNANGQLSGEWARATGGGEGDDILGSLGRRSASCVVELSIEHVEPIAVDSPDGLLGFVAPLEDGQDACLAQRSEAAPAEPEFTPYLDSGEARIAQ